MWFTTIPTYLFRDNNLCGWAVYSAYAVYFEDMVALF